MRSIQDGRPKKGKVSSITCHDCSSVDTTPVYDGYGWHKCGACDSFRGFNVSGLKCNCGGTVFQITETRICCTNCGADNLWDYNEVL